MPRRATIVMGLMLLVVIAGIVVVEVRRSQAAEQEPKSSPFKMNPGTVCEVILRPDCLADPNRWITPAESRENVNGSQTSVWGKLHSFDEDYIILELADIKVDTSDDGESVTTHGAADELRRYYVIVPQRSVALVRVMPAE